MGKEKNVLYLPKNKNTMEQRFKGSPQTSPAEHHGSPCWLWPPLDGGSTAGTVWDGLL